MKLLPKLYRRIQNRSNSGNDQIAPNEALEQNENDLKETVEDNTTIIIVALLLTVIFILLFSQTGRICSILIGTVYPVYNTILALDLEGQDKIKWLKYWIVYALFSFLSGLLDFLIGSISVYWFLKCMFIVWLMLPNDSFNGSSLLYTEVVRPYYAGLNSIIHETEETRELQ